MRIRRLLVGMLLLDLLVLAAIAHAGCPGTPSLVITAPTYSQWYRTEVGLSLSSAPRQRVRLSGPIGCAEFAAMNDSGAVGTVALQVAADVGGTVGAVLATSSASSVAGWPTTPAAGFAAWQTVPLALALATPADVWIGLVPVGPGSDEADHDALRGVARRVERDPRDAAAARAGRDGDTDPDADEHADPHGDPDGEPDADAGAVDDGDQDEHADVDGDASADTDAYGDPHDGAAGRAGRGRGVHPADGRDRREIREAMTRYGWCETHKCDAGACLSDHVVRLDDFRKAPAASSTVTETGFCESDDIGPPGVWTCPSCGLVCARSNLNARDGSVTPSQTVPEPCPNDGATLRRLTWREQAVDMLKRATEQMERARDLETQLATAAKKARAFDRVCDRLAEFGDDADTALRCVGEDIQTWEHEHPEDATVGQLLDTLDYDACVTGDCPHDHANACLESLAEAIRGFCGEAKAALGLVENPARVVTHDGPTLKFWYDRDTDVLTVEGVRFAGGLFRTLAWPRDDRWYRFERQGSDCVVTVVDMPVTPTSRQSGNA